MGTSTLVTLVIVLLIGFGIRRILRDWQKKFAEDDKHAEARRRAYLDRNREDAKSADVTTLERGRDGVYRPKE